MSPPIRGIHLVGSLPLPSASSVFTQLPALLPGRLRRLPDGEPEHRQLFTFWQQAAFQATPGVLKTYDPVTFTVTGPNDPVGPEDIARVVAKLGAGGENIHTGYDVHALASYAVFCERRQEGVVPLGVRFQVCLPSPVDVVVLLAGPLQAALEPLCEAALLRDLAKIVAAIPSEDLAVQWDVASPFAMMDSEAWRPDLKPYMADPERHVKEMVVRLGEAVPEGVQCGFHFCYGNYERRHYAEPILERMVDAAQVVLENVKRKIDWVHVPVPKGTEDEAYFRPLEKVLPMMEMGTELCLGLVQPDEHTTRRTIEAAGKVVKGGFGIGTECGLARNPREEFGPTMEVAAKVSAPVV